MVSKYQSKRFARYLRRSADLGKIWHCRTLNEALDHIAEARKRRQLTRTEKDVLIYAENRTREDVKANARKVAAMHPKTIGDKAFRCSP